MYICINNCIDWYQLVVDWRNQHMNITSLYAVILKTFHFNALTVNRRTILSPFSSPSPQVLVFLWQIKSLFLFLPPVHTYPMKKLTKLGNTNVGSLKTLSNVENYLIPVDIGQYCKLVATCLHTKILVTEVVLWQTMSCYKIMNKAAIPSLIHTSLTFTSKRQRL